MKKLIWGFVCLLFCIFSNSQLNAEFEKAKNESKNGLILPFSRVSYIFIILPEELPVYDAHKKQAGVLSVEEDYEEGFGYIVLLSNGNRTQIDLHDEVFKEVAYEEFALKYTDIKDDFLKVLESHGDYWISIHDLEKAGFTNLSWINFLIQKKFSYYANKPGLRLRESPNTDSRILSTIKGQSTIIEVTGEISGNWAKVKIFRLKKDSCPIEENIDYVYVQEGWIKIVNDDGYPNVYFYPRGC